MRLLKTNNYTFQYFMDATKCPEYAILSHCWGEDEIVYAQMRDQSFDKSGQGWRKIEECCRLAASQGLQWVWIDTCCINKDSSAELTEAINSMFSWYNDAKICFAFLWNADCSAFPKFTNIKMFSDWKDDLSFEEQTKVQTFVDSRWFTRGWTLQELVAPVEVSFYNREMTLIGTKSSLRAILADITGIDEIYLWGEQSPQHTDRVHLKETGPSTQTRRNIRLASVAQRMSWASQRKTTRLEDLAYCLLGLFDVNMPLLYGEGEKAFIRLQQEIIKQSSDRTIFAWKDDSVEKRMCGVFATHPDQFRGCQHVEQREDKTFRQAEYYITNHGLQLSYVTLPSDYRTLWSFWGPSSFLSSINIGYARTVEAGSSGAETRMSDIRLTLYRQGTRWYRTGLRYDPESSLFDFVDRITNFLAPVRYFTLVHVREEWQSTTAPVVHGPNGLFLFLSMMYRSLFLLSVPFSLFWVPSRFYTDSRFGWSVLTLLTVLANEILVLKLYVFACALGIGIEAVRSGS